MTRASKPETTVSRRYRVTKSDAKAIDLIAEANDLSQQEAISRLIAFAGSVRDDAAVAYMLGLVPRSFKADARARLLDALAKRDGV